MQAINSKEGFIGCARGNQGLYKYKIDDDANFSCETILPKGHFLDMIYFKKHRTLFLHDDKDCKVYKVGPQSKVTVFSSESCTNGLGGR